jgi:nucleotide-binding universal stress UspA family protein
VRVARGRADAQNASQRLIIGFDGSTDAEAAIREVASRSWPKDTEVRLITAVDQRMMTAIAARILKLRPWLKPAEKGDHHTWLSKMLEGAAEKLGAYLKTTCSLSEGEPKRVLLEAAEQWSADCIFLGATGLRGLRRLLVGSVSCAVTAHAPCTVEIVRARTSGVLEGM